MLENALRCAQAIDHRGAARFALGVLLVLLWAGPAAAQTLQYGPILGRGLTPDKLIVKWGTDGLTDSTAVYYAPMGTASFQTATGAAARDHEVVLGGLSQGMTYQYYVQSGALRTAAGSFSTCPAPGMPMDVVFYGDSRSNPAAHQSVVNLLSKRNPEMVFESGDIVLTGQYGLYLSEFFPVVKALAATTPYMAALGNHDAATSPNVAQNYGLVFPAPRLAGAPWQPYYTFRCGNAQFVSLNSNLPEDAGQLSFLNSTLGAAAQDSSVRHVLVWLHHPPYSPGTSHGDNAQVQTAWVPLFNRAGSKVQVVFTGHDHIYARMSDGGPVVYVVSGGAGAELYSVGGKSAAKTLMQQSTYNYVVVHIGSDSITGTAYGVTGMTEAVIDTWTAQRFDTAPDGGVQDGGVQDGSAPDARGAGAGLGRPGGGCSAAGPAAAGGSAICGLGIVALALLRYLSRASGAGPG